MTPRDFETQILGLIESSIEDTRVPDAIAAHADKRAGKPVTKTDAEQLEAQLGVPVRIRRQYGMTSVAWAIGTGLNPWLDERSILLAHSDSNVRWPTGSDLRKKEPAYFGARDERNAARKKLLGEHHAQEIFFARIAAGTTTQTGPVDRTSLVTRAAAAVAKIREAQAELAKILDYGEPLHVVHFAVEKLVKGE
jgi:hypothetical protein